MFRIFRRRKRTYFLYENGDNSSTFDENGEECCNCQIVAILYGRSPEEALKEYAKEGGLGGLEFDDLSLVEVKGKTLWTSMEEIEALAT